MKYIRIVTGIVLYIVMALIVGGLLTYCGWNWFGVEVFPQYGAITFKTALILNFAKGLIFYRISKRDTSKSNEELLKDNFTNILTALFILFIFWIIKLIIL